MLSEKENVKKKNLYIYIELITSVHSMIIAPYHQTNIPIDFRISGIRIPNPLFDDNKYFTS